MHPATPRRHSAAAAAAWVVAALLGAWLGHTLEYLRVGGAPGVGGALLAGVHAYMLPLGALLVLAAALGGAAAWRVWEDLGRRLDGARAGLIGALRGHPPATPAPGIGPAVSLPARLVALWLPLAAVQVAVYLGQENLESALAGTGATGLRPLLGVHGAAAAVHLAVALVLAAVLLLAGRLLAARAGELERCERLLRALWGRLRSAGRPPARARARLAPPVDRFGRHLWSRPPPALP